MNGGNSNVIILSAYPSSKSRRYALYRGKKLLVSMHFETENGSKIVNIKTSDDSSRQKITNHEYKQPLSFFLIWIISNNIIQNDSEIDVVGLRVVAPGAYFRKNRRITDHYLEKLGAHRSENRPQIKIAIREIKKIMSLLPQTKLVAISDTIYHQTARNIDDSLHGISIQSAINKLDYLAGKLHPKVVVCHLDDETSVTAVKNGKSFDSIEIHTASRLFEHTGMKNVLRLYREGHPGVKKSLDKYIFSLNESIELAVSKLNGLDIFVITGTSGIRFGALRKMLLNNLDTIDLYLDLHKNNTLKHDAFINSHGKIGIAVIETDEMGEIARQVNELQ